MNRGKSSRRKVGRDYEDNKNDATGWVAPTIRKKNASLDKISQLPDEILLQILSLLSPRDRVVSRIFSKTWHSLSPAGWYFNSRSIAYGTSSKDIEGHINESLRAFSSKGLTFRTCTFSVHLGHFPKRSIDPSIKAIIEGNFHTLHLRYEGHYCEPCRLPSSIFRLPSSIFSATSLSGLCLHGCELWPYDSYDVDFKFNCLQELRLEEVKLSKRSLMSFFKMCRNIVNLRLKQCRLIEHIDTRGLEFLEKIEILDCTLSEKISINSPHLHTLTFRGIWGTVPAIDLGYPGQLETLILNTTFFPNFNFAENFSDLTKIRKLLLSGCLDKKKIEIFNSSLESLELYYGGRMVQVLVNTPNLQYFKSFDRDFEQLTFLMSMGSRLKKIRLDFNRNYVIDATWLFKLRAFVQNLGHDSTLSLRLAGVVALKLEELAEKSVPPECYLRKLKLKQLSSLLSMHGKVLINAILRSVRPETLKIQLNSDSGSFVKELRSYLKFDKGALIKCCKLTPTKCWRHYLQGVDIDVFTKTSKKRPFKEQVNFSIKFQWDNEETKIGEKRIAN